jgi:hypothetical protein
MRAPQLFAAASVAAMLAVVCEAASPATSQSSIRPFTVGYLQTIANVGMLEVVARFTGERWVNTWEGNGDKNTPVLPLDQIPLSWLGKQVPRQWTAWNADGRSRTVHVSGTARGPACQAPTMLTLASGDAGPADQAEVTLDTDQPVLGFRELRPSDRDADRATMEAAALGAFRERAPAEAARYRGSDSLPKSALTPETLSGQPVIVAFLSRTAAPSPAIAYFEAFQPSKVNANYGIRVSGWLHRVDGTWSVAGVAADVRGADSASIPTRRPLGIFQLAGHDFLLVRLIRYEGWGTGIYEIEGNTLRAILTTPGGGC